MAGGVFGISIEGGEKIAAHLDKIVDMVRADLEDIAVVGALPVLNEIRRRTPVKTGTLRRSEHIGGHTDATPEWAGNISGIVDTEGYTESTLSALALYGGGMLPTKSGKPRMSDRRAARDVETFGEIAGPTKTDMSVTLHIGTNLSYARAVEYGRRGRAGRAMFRSTVGDTAVFSRASRQSMAAFRLLLKKGFGK